jgi:hypothetical protein
MACYRDIDLYGLKLSISVGFKQWLHIFRKMYFLTYDPYFTIFHEITVVGTSMSHILSFQNTQQQCVA